MTFTGAGVTLARCVHSGTTTLVVPVADEETSDGCCDLGAYHPVTSGLSEHPCMRLSVQSLTDGVVSHVTHSPAIAVIAALPPSVITAPTPDELTTPGVEMAITYIPPPRTRLNSFCTLLI